MLLASFIKHGRNLANWALVAGMAASLLAVPAPAQAAHVVGRVITVVGEVFATGAAWEERPLERRSRIYEQDMITTGGDGRVKVRFIDGGVVDIEPETRFEVERYRKEASGERGEGAFMRLWKGAFRTITGAIGSEDKDDYKVETPAATLGIRGTQYAARYCEGDCGRSFRTGEPIAAGLYVKVEKGRVRVSNNTGTRDFGADQYSYVASVNADIVELKRPPGLIFSGDDPFREEGAGGEDLFRPGAGDQRPFWPGKGEAEQAGPSLIMDEQGNVIGVEEPSGEGEGSE